MSWRLYLPLHKQPTCVWVVRKTTMWIVLFLVSCTNLLVKGGGNEEFLGKGQWLVLNQLQCDNPEQYEIKVMSSRRKINRTHDAFSIHADLDREINVTYGIELIAYKEVDGGFKFFQKLTDESLCNMLKKYAGDNFSQLLAKGNIDPPDCPIPKGPFIIEDYVLDYEQLEETGMYGTYDAWVYITYMYQRVACERWLVRFEKKCEHEDDDDDY